MNKRILNIIGIIVKQVLMNKEILLNENEILEYLLSTGYSIEDINTAFSWIRELTGDRQVSTKKIKFKPNAIRILSLMERMNFSVEAYGFIIKAKELGFIDDEMQEEIIERSQYLSTEEVGIDEIKHIMASVVMSYTGERLGDYIDRFINNEWESSLN